MLVLKLFHSVFIFGVALLCKTNAHGDEFGFNILSVDRTRQGGYLGLTVTIRAPPNSQYYWAFGYGYLPVLDLDRFSSVKNKEANGVVISRLRTSVVDEGYVTFKIFTYDPAYRGMGIDIKTEQEDSRRFYNNTCEYLPPSRYEEEDRIVATATFTCHMLPEQDLSDTATGIEYRAETISKTGGKTESFASITSENDFKTALKGKLTVTKVVKKDKAWIESQAGVLGVFEMIIKMTNNDSGPVYGFRYFVEDGKSFDGERNNSIDPGVFEPYSLVVSHESMTSSQRQAFISCHAIGSEIPEVEIFKQTKSGGEIPLPYAKMVHKTTFSATVYYVINSPSPKDVGVFICRSRLGSVEKKLIKGDHFYPQIAPDIVDNQSGITDSLYKDKIKLAVRGSEDMVIACFSNSKDGLKLNVEEMSFFRVQKGQPSVTEYFVKWPIGKYGYIPSKVYCKATNIYGVDWVEIDRSKRIVMNY